MSGPAIFLSYITDANAIILRAIYAKRDIDADNNLLEGDHKTTAITLGKYLDDTSTIEFSYIGSDTETRSTASNQTFSNDTNQYDISYRTVRPLDTISFYHFGVSVELIKSDTSSVKEDNHELEIEGQYYFTRMTSLGAEASFNSGDNTSQEGKSFAVNVSHFFIPQIGLNAGLTRFIAKDSQTEDTDSVFVEAVARF